MPVLNPYPQMRRPSEVVTTQDELAKRLAAASSVNYTNPTEVARDYIRQNAEQQANGQWGGSAPQSAIDMFFQRFANIAQNPQQFAGNYQALENPETGARVSGDNTPIADAMGSPDKFYAWQSYAERFPQYQAAQQQEMAGIRSRMDEMQKQRQIVQGSYDSMTGGGAKGGVIPGLNNVGFADGGWNQPGFGVQPQQQPQQNVGGLGGLGGWGGPFSNKNAWAVG